MITSLSILALLWGPVQEPPCLSAFERVIPVGPSLLLTTDTIERVEVDGNTALTISRKSLISQPSERFVHVFEKDPAFGTWTCTQGFQLDGMASSHYADTFQLEGERAIIAVEAYPRREVVILEPDPATGLWGPVTSIAFKRQIHRARLAGDRIAIGLDYPDRIEVWIRDPAGNYMLEYTLLPPPGAYFFHKAFAFDGERIVSNVYGMLLYRRDATGSWFLEDPLAWAPTFSVAFLNPPPFLAGDRVAQFGKLSGPGHEDALAFWRLSAGGPTASAWDGLVSEQKLGNALPTSESQELAAGTLLQPLLLPTCGSLNPDFWPLAVITFGPGDVPEVRGQICHLAGFGIMGDAQDFSYDGRTLAVAVRHETGAPPNTVHFATLLGADHDRNANCLADAVEIAGNPALDQNANGKLDMFEERGVENCLPTTPNSSGTTARLSIIGSEFTVSNDLAAVAQGLPPSAFAQLAVALAPQPAGPMGPFGLCLGAGAPQGLGRYPAGQADAVGTVIQHLDPAAIPSGLAPIVAISGQTFGWQFIYRDTGIIRTSSAVRVLLL